MNHSYNTGMGPWSGRAWIPWGATTISGWNHGPDFGRGVSACQQISSKICRANLLPSFSGIQQAVPAVLVEHQDLWLVCWWLLEQTSTAWLQPPERRIWPLKRQMNCHQSSLQDLQGVMLLLFIFYFFFLPSFQEHPGKSFSVLYFHLSLGLLWTAEVIVRVNFRDLKGSNLKASAWKCKLQLESCQVLWDRTWRGAAAQGILAHGQPEPAAPLATEFGKRAELPICSLPTVL